MSSSYVAFILGSMRTGGAEKSVLNLCNYFSRNEIKTDLVLIDETGDLLQSLSRDVKIIDLKKKKARFAVFAFLKYLKKNSPEVLIAVQTHVQVMVLLACLFTRKKPILILNEQSTFSSNIKNKFFRFFVLRLFKRADAITVVSADAANDLLDQLPSLKKKITVIPNPVNVDEILRLKEEKVSHPFLIEKKSPVILSAGRLVKSKGYLLLVIAFKLVLEKLDCRLIILGKGPERKVLEDRIRELKISEFVSMPGNIQNPYPYMKHSDVFVLSSDYEGLPTVLIEALACDCNIVSTDCRSGPREILSDGKFGELVPVGNTEMLAEGILRKISEKRDDDSKLRRAREFDIDLIASEYLELIKELKGE